MREISKIIIHCSATREGEDYTVTDIRQWHTLPEPQGRGWRDIGYHYIVYRDGTIHEGRPLDQVGSHTKGYNENSIGICYIGGLDKEGKAKDTRTAEQKKELADFVRRLKIKYPKVTVHGHNEFANKACPCFDVEKEFR